jgi:hypothetical protein
MAFLAARKDRTVTDDLKPNDTPPADPPVDPGNKRPTEGMAPEWYALTRAQRDEAERFGVPVAHYEDENALRVRREAAEAGWTVDTYIRLSSTPINVHQWAAATGRDSSGRKVAAKDPETGLFVKSPE